MAENVSPPRSQPATPPELLGPTLDRSLVLEQHLSSTSIARLLHSLTPPSALPELCSLTTAPRSPRALQSDSSLNVVNVDGRAEVLEHPVSGAQEERCSQPACAGQQQLPTAGAPPTGIGASQPQRQARGLSRSGAFSRACGQPSRAGGARRITIAQPGVPWWT